MWPVLAYLSMGVWLAISPLLSMETWKLLLPLNAVAHYIVALSLATVGAEMMRRSRVIGLVLFLIFAWEVFEVWWFGTLLVKPLTLAHWTDTGSDIVLGIAGMLTGVYFGNEPLNTAKALGNTRKR